MAEQNLISFNMNTEDESAINAAIQVLQEKLMPHLLSLTPEERQEMAKMGDKTVAFVTKSLEYAGQKPEIVPQYINNDEFEKDVNGVSKLREFYQPIEGICNALSDTIMVAGSEAYSAALSVYHSIKDAAKRGVPGAQTIYDDLKQRFPGRPRK